MGNRILNIIDGGLDMDNTNGYSQSELDALNEELEERLQKRNIEHGSAEYWDTIGDFEDEIARRR